VTTTSVHLTRHVSRRNTVAKNIANHHNRKKQETTRVIEKVVSHEQQQLTGEMTPYLSTKKMPQSLWRKEQQQWRDAYCSHVLPTAATIFL